MTDQPVFDKIADDILDETIRALPLREAIVEALRAAWKAGYAVGRLEQYDDADRPQVDEDGRFKVRWFR